MTYFDIMSFKIPFQYLVVWNRNSFKCVHLESIKLSEVLHNKLYSNIDLSISCVDRLFFRLLLKKKNIDKILTTAGNIETLIEISITHTHKK